MSFLANVLISGVLRLGIMSGHDMSEYRVPDSLGLIDTKQTTIADFKVETVFGKYVFANGGFVCYSLPARHKFGVYPFRQDYTFSFGLKWKFLSLGTFHGCYHPLSPYLRNSPLPKIDCSQDEIFLEAKNQKKINFSPNISAEGLLRAGYFTNIHVVEYYADELYVYNLATTLLKCRAELTLWKYFLLNGDISLYSTPKMAWSSFCRPYCSFGAGIQCGNYRLVLSHECLQHVAPNVSIPLFGRIENANYMLYIQTEFGKK